MNPITIGLRAICRKGDSLRLFFSVLLALLGLSLAGERAGAQPAAPARPADVTLRGPPLQVITKINMPTVGFGRIYHMTGDAVTKQVYVSCIANNTVEVIDAETEKVIFSMAGLNKPKGIVHLGPDFDKLYVVSGGDDTVRVFDGSCLPLKTIRVGEEMDFIHYDRATKKVFVKFADAEGRGGIAEIDPATDSLTGTVFRTSGVPEDFAIAKSGKRIFVNVPSSGGVPGRNVVDVFDRGTGAAVHWSIRGSGYNSAMLLLDDDNRLLINTVKTWKGLPPQLVVLDTGTGKEVARMTEAGPALTLSFDPIRKRIYVPGGEGVVSVFQQEDPDHYRLLAEVPTGTGTRSGYYFARRDFYYVPVFGGPGPAQVWIFRLQN